MAISGNIRDLSLPTMVQSIIHEGGTAHIEIRNETSSGSLYLTDGVLKHAELKDDGKVVETGESVVFELLNWQDGEFTIDRNVLSAQQTIQNDWRFLLMEGLRKADEKQAKQLNIEDAENREEPPLETMLTGLSPEDAAAIQALANQGNGENIMATKSEQIKAILEQTISNSSDIAGAAVVDNDGLLLASMLSGSVDGNRVAAVSAGLISLANRSAQQLNQGEVSQTLIKAENGNIIVLQAGPRASFVALTTVNANLGMAFLECQDAAGSIKEYMLN